ncbi:MAG TPA: flagellar regulator YcgR PilZN domain-containing protein, partial [Pseudomonadales bacterium]|nr:flagellar regulator YcgR PilZN domain-containing protein [Pseudomonadales bacterium]
MFDFLKNVFASLSSGADRISDKRQILRVFVQLCDNRANLTLQFVDHKKSHENYTTNVIAIHPSERRVVLDELIPREGNLLVGKKAECILKVISGGKFYQFQAVLLPVVGEKPPCYTMDLPSLIELSQKRGAYRLSISRVQSTGVLLNTANREPLSGRIIDISATGARVELHTIVSPPFKSGDNIEKCILTLPDKARITCK